MSKLRDVKGVGAGPYFVTEGDDDELGAKWYMVNGPGIPDPKMTATTDRDEAIVSASIRNRAYAEGLRMAEGIVWSKKGGEMGEVERDCSCGEWSDPNIVVHRKYRPCYLRERNSGKEMSEIDSGGKAFPSHGTMGEVTHEGMTLRQWFAGMALQGMVDSDADVDPEFVGTMGKWGDVVAKRAYQYADAMIRAGKGEK